MLCKCQTSGFLIVGGHGKPPSPRPHPMIFSTPPPPIKTDALYGVPPLKNEAPQLKNKHHIEN